MIKIIVAILLLAITSSTFVEDITEARLEEIKTSSKIWLVYGAKHPSDTNPAILHEISQVLAGFYKIGLLPEGDGVLRLYGDDGEIVEYRGDFLLDPIVDFLLTNTNAVIQARSKIANEVKANKEFKQKQAERANKQWNDEQQLRKKSDVLVLTQKTWESSFLKEREPYFINFYEANCSACIDLNKQWEGVATTLKGKARVAKLNITEAERLESQIQLPSYPSIRFYPAGVKKVDSYQEFEGVKKKFSILEWANGKLSEKKSAVDITELNKENYETLCKQSKSTCIIAFTEDPSEISAKIGQLAAKHVKKPITFLVSKKGSQPEFEKQTGVQSAPDTVFIYCKQKKMLRLGNMDFNAIEDTINEISNGNRNNFVKYSFAEQLN